MIQDLAKLLQELDKKHEEYLLEKQIIEAKTKNPKFRCFHPEHSNGDSDPSAAFVPGSTGLIHCFGCGSNWGIQDSYSFLEGTPGKDSPNWLSETIEPLAKHFGVPFSLTPMSDQEKKDLSILNMFKDVSNYLRLSEQSTEVTKEIKKRKWKKDILHDALGAGTVKSYNDFIDHLKKQGYSQELIEEADLARDDIFNPNNIIFPIKDVKGNIVAFNARNTTFVKGINDRNPKWVHSSSSRLFNKSKILFGSDLLSKLVTSGKTKSVYIVEGTGDWIAAYQSGLKNIVAALGSAVTEQHFSMLKRLGVSEVYLCLDNDDAGIKACNQIVKNYHFFNGLKVFVCQVGDPGQDLEDFFKDHTLQDFRAKVITCNFLEWYLRLLLEAGNTEDELVEKLCDIPANESDPLVIHRYAEIIADLTNLPIGLIKEKISYIKEINDQKIEVKKEQALSQAIAKLRESPSTAIDTATTLIETFDALSKGSQDQIYGFEECLEALNEQQIKEETKPAGIDGFTLKRHVRLQNILYGPWRQRCLFLIGGKANVGKTNLMTDLALDIALSNDGYNLDQHGAKTKRTTVLYYSNDDPRQKIINRMVTNIASDSMKSVTFNMISNPEHYIKNMHMDLDLTTIRTASYNQLRQLIANERLLLKDVKQGVRLDYLRSQLVYLRKKYPNPEEYPIVLFLDNLSKTETEANIKDQAEARKISEAVKKWCSLYDVTVIATVEYPKLASGSRPSDNNFRDTEQLRYDADITAHFINDFAEDPNSEKYWWGNNNFEDAKVGDPENNQWPIVELFISKNKITQYKNIPVFYDMIPMQARFREITKSVLLSRSITSGGAEYIKEVPGVDQ